MVEVSDDDWLCYVGWVFLFYLFVMIFLVLFIVVMGCDMLLVSVNFDLYVLELLLL